MFILKIIVIILSLIALADNPYFYYQILRWVVCGTSAYLAYDSYKNKKDIIWTWIFGITAVIFNPIASFVFGRDIWSVLNVACVIVFITSIFIKNPHGKQAK